jgi:hypothetical protein
VPGIASRPVARVHHAARRILIVGVPIPPPHTLPPSLLPTAVTRYQVVRTGIVRRVRHSHHPQLALSLTILLQRVPQSLPAAREQPSAGPWTVRRAFGTSSFEGLVATDRADRQHTIFRHGTRVRYPPRESGAAGYSRPTDTCARPLKFRARAAAGVRSMIRDLRCGPRSLIVTMIERPFRLFSTRTRAPHGSVLCAAVSADSFSSPPQATLEPLDLP